MRKPSRSLSPEALALIEQTAIEQDIDVLKSSSTAVTQAARLQQILDTMSDESVQTLNAIAEYRKRLDPTERVLGDPPSGPF